MVSRTPFSIKYFDFPKMDIYKCPKTENQKTFPFSKPGFFPYIKPYSNTRSEHGCVYPRAICVDECGQAQRCFAWEEGIEKGMKV
jgi:hypothetical protein